MHYGLVSNKTALLSLKKMIPLQEILQEIKSRNGQKYFT